MGPKHRRGVYKYFNNFKIGTGTVKTRQLRASAELAMVRVALGPKILRKTQTPKNYLVKLHLEYKGYCFF
jgi:hypothetical protein